MMYVAELLMSTKILRKHSWQDTRLEEVSWRWVRWVTSFLLYLFSHECTISQDEMWQKWCHLLERAHIYLSKYHVCLYYRRSTACWMTLDMTSPWSENSLLVNHSQDCHYSSQVFLSRKASIRFSEGHKVWHQSNHILHQFFHSS